jgi:hypothetical protein
MGASDGKVIGATLIVDNGSPAERFNLVLVAEGYRETELDTFASDAQDFVDGLFATEPFDRHRCAINVWRLDVASDDSGADDPAGNPCGGTGAMPDTFFDARFCSGGVPRALVCNSGLVLQTVAQHVPQFHSAQVIVNSSKYGGTGGVVGTASTATKNSKGNPVDWREILIHEMGHSIFGLADEYAYLQGCDVPDPGHDNFGGFEPAQPNVTASPTAQGKWDDLINTASLPTWETPDCGKCPPEPDTPGGPADDGTVGTFEGAHHFHCGAYRPQAECKMRKLGVPFCAVCTRVIDEFLAPFDPSFCFTRDMLDTSRWVAVATILFGVIQDGGGVILVGGKPIPIDPWGPLRHSLWAAMATPHEAPPAVRDVLVGMALQQISSLLSSPELRARMETAAGELVDQAAARLPAATIR